ncbi:MAG: DUF4339 domain-containing protein [Alphaproteobacteria bacterium]|nr:DUF4339 domain-containing protein [Alphaproteobacteria bacterium]
MSESWTISVGGRIYGPYSLEQMQGFHAEGRLADHSLIARSGEEQFHPAHEDADLAALFMASGVEQPQADEPAHVETAHIETAHGDAGHAAPHRFGRSEPEIPTGPSHYVIIADMKSRSIAGLEEEIFNMGPAHHFMPQAWVLTSEISLNTIRNRLVQKLGKIDTLFIVDAARDKAAWFNFGPENDSRVRRMWSRPQEFSGTERRSIRRA